MSRDLSALFQEEAAELQQSQVLHLLMIELTVLSTCTASAGSTTISVADASEFSDGQYVSIDGVDGVRQVLSVDPLAKTAEINEPVDVAVAEAAVRLQLPLVDANYTVQFDGIKYTQFPVQFSEISVNSDGTIDKAGLTVANVSREIMYYVELYDGLRNCLVTVKTVFHRFLDFTYFVDADGNVNILDNPDADPSAYVEDAFVIDSYAADESAVQFILDPAVNLSVKLPHRRYTSDSCYWRYLDPNSCGLDLQAFLQQRAGEVGEFDPSPFYVCNKTYSDCALRKNSARFGGFPGITGARRVFL